ncbi:MAG: hypothetical protein ACK4UJ_08430 [Leptonema sp. (in: bacteria)]
MFRYFISIVFFNIYIFYLNAKDFFYLEKCKISILINKKDSIIEQTEDSITILKNSKEIEILFCKENLLKTFDLKPNTEPLEFKVRTIQLHQTEKIKTLKGYLEIKKGNFPSANQKMDTYCKFTFGTRDLIFNMIYYNSHLKSKTEACKKEILDFLNTIHFTEEIIIPITEEEYKKRLRMIGFFLILLLVVIFFSIKKKFSINLRLNFLQNRKNT